MEGVYLLQLHQVRTFCRYISLPVIYKREYELLQIKRKTCHQSTRYISPLDEKVILFFSNGQRFEISLTQQVPKNHLTIKLLFTTV